MLRNLRSRLRRRGGSSLLLLVAAVLVLLAAFGPLIWGDTAARLDTEHVNEGMSAQHWLGTDSLGRDVLARTLVATRQSLVMAVLAATIAAGSGILLGCLAALLRGRAGRALTAGLHWALAFPPVIVALFVCAILGPGAAGAVLAIGVALAPGFARVAQTLAVQVSGSEYVAAARTVGIGQRRILTRYLMPNIAEPVIIQATVTVGNALVSIAALSFLGLGVQPPKYDWGRMLAEGLDKIFTTPVVALAPATAIIVTGLVFAQVGDILAQFVQGGNRGHSATYRSPVTDRSGTDGAGTSGTGRDSVYVVEDLSVRVAVPGGDARIVHDFSWSIERGERVGIIGESGSGKTMTVSALASLLPDGAVAHARRQEFLGNDLVTATPRALRRMLGLDLAMVFQDPGASLNPMLRVSRQLTEAVQEFRGFSESQATERAIETLRAVDISAPERRMRQYPHELSGGMRQRAMIAMGLMGQPSLLIADEPTTALDVTVQAQVLDLLLEVNRTQGTAIVLVTHDVGVVAELCERVVVMYAGRIVEDSPIEAFLSGPSHPYSRALLAAVPDLHTDTTQPLVAIGGSPPPLTDLPEGCSYATRCELATDVCSRQPSLRPITPGRRVACWRAEELATGDTTIERETAEPR